MQLLNGYINEVKELTTKFGQRVVMKCVIGGREAEVWRNAKDADCLLSIPSGTQAQFTYDSKGKYHLVDGSLKSTNGAVAVAETEAIVKAETVTVTETTVKTEQMGGMTVTKRTKTDSSIPPETKRAIAGYVQDLAELYGFCLKTAGTIDGINDNDRRQIATTLFISTKDKFNL